MNRTGSPAGCQGGYLVGFVIIAAVALRLVLVYQSNLAVGVRHEHTGDDHLLIRSQYMRLSECD